MAPPKKNSGGSIVLFGVPELRMFPTHLDRQRALAGVAYEADQFGTRRGLAGLAIYMAGMFIGVLVAGVLGELFLTGELSLVNPSEGSKFFAMIGGVIGCLAAMCWQHRRVGRQVLRRHLVRCGVPVCLRCGYDLRGLPGTNAQCPECGDELSNAQKQLLASDA